VLNHNTKVFTQRAAPLMAFGHARQAAGPCSAKADGVRLAVASLLGSNVLALVESATALRRDVVRAGGQRLQVVRIACLAARVRRDAAGVHASIHNSAIAERAAQRRER